MTTTPVSYKASGSSQFNRAEISATYPCRAVPANAEGLIRTQINFVRMGTNTNQARTRVVSTPESITQCGYGGVVTTAAGVLMEPSRQQVIMQAESLLRSIRSSTAPSTVAIWAMVCHNYCILDSLDENWNYNGAAADFDPVMSASGCIQGIIAQVANGADRLLVIEMTMRDWREIAWVVRLLLSSETCFVRDGENQYWHRARFSPRPAVFIIWSPAY